MPYLIISISSSFFTIVSHWEKQVTVFYPAWKDRALASDLHTHFEHQIAHSLQLSADKPLIPNQKMRGHDSLTSPGVILCQTSKNHLL